MAIPTQGTYNSQDDFSPGSGHVKGGNLESSGPEAEGFSHLQRAYRKGGVVPDYPSDPGTMPGRTSDAANQS